MKNYLLILFVILSYSCSDSNDKKTTLSDKLVAPQFSELTASGTPFTGALVVYACNITTSAYFGNYTSMPDELKIFPATYLFGKNNYIKPTPGVLLPVGDYSFIYWGVPNSATPTYNSPASREPALSFGRIMKDAVISLVPTQYNSDVYFPAYDYVFARQDIGIGQEMMSGNLLRATGGVVVYLTNIRPGPFDEAISEMYVEIGSVAKDINFYTSAPSNFTVSVRIPLTIASDRLDATNDMAMLFPSGDTLPSITIKIRLVDGTVKSYTRVLTNHIDAGNILTIGVSIGDILVNPGDASFSVEGWTETKEEIFI